MSNQLVPQDIHDKNINNATFYGLLVGFTIGAFAVLMVLGFKHLITPEPPALVGFNCEGATGALYATEEDHFPICERIQAFE